jgi:hypothetical protein
MARDYEPRRFPSFSPQEPITISDAPHPRLAAVPVDAGSEGLTLDTLLENYRSGSGQPRSPFRQTAAMTMQRQKRGPPNGQRIVETGEPPSGRSPNFPTARPAPRPAKDFSTALFVCPFVVSTRHPAVAPSVWSPAFMRSGCLPPSVFRHNPRGNAALGQFRCQSVPFGAFFAICLCYFSFSAFQHFSILGLGVEFITILSQFYHNFPNSPIASLRLTNGRLIALMFPVQQQSNSSETYEI